MDEITKIKVNGDPESSYQLYPRNEEFAKRGSATDAETLNLLIEEDMLPAVHNAGGGILTDQNGNIVLRY